MMKFVKVFILIMVFGISSVFSGSFPVQAENYTEVVFDEVGEHEFEVPAGVTSIDVLVVAGGASGGCGQPNVQRNGGAGGAGGLIFIEDYIVTSSAKIVVIVGKGGESRTLTDISGVKGDNSSFGALIAVGGGAGGAAIAGGDGHGYAGGSGGGGGVRGVAKNLGGAGVQPIQDGDSGEYGFGNKGGDAVDYITGGGGGAGSEGSSGVAGSGKEVFGKVYAVGGTPLIDTVHGDANSGNGGSSSPADKSCQSVPSGAGGSGVVIIRYVSGDGDDEEVLFIGGALMVSALASFVIFPKF